MKEANRRSESAYSAAGAAPWFPLPANRPAKNCCTILERGQKIRQERHLASVCFQTHTLYFLHVFFFISQLLNAAAARRTRSVTQGGAHSGTETKDSHDCASGAR